MCWAKLWDTKVDKTLLKMMRADRLTEPHARCYGYSDDRHKANFMMALILKEDKQCVKCCHGDC